MIFSRKLKRLYLNLRSRKELAKLSKDLSGYLVTGKIEVGSKGNAIFCIVDEKYFEYLTTFLNSIKENYPKHPEILIFYSGLSKGQLEFLSKKYSKIKLIKDFTYSCPQKLVAPLSYSMAYKRFILWTNYFEDYNKILHLDIDIVVLKPLDRIFEETDFVIMNNEGEIFGEACSPFLERSITRNKLQKLLKADGLVLDSTMANGGVFMIPPKYRNKKYFDQIMEILLKYHEHVKYSQAILTIWARINNIPIRRWREFNFQPFFFALPDNKLGLNDIYILHFTSPVKPGRNSFTEWKLIRHRLIELEKIYFKYKYPNYEMQKHQICK